MTPDDGPLPPPLPVRVRPAAGETAESYIRRLARANHLRPSLLQVYVRNPDVPTAAIRLRRLAAASGSTLTALARALTGLPPASGPHRPPPGKSQAARKARLFRIIIDDAARGMSIRQIASRHHVHRRMIRQALAAPAGPPPRKQAARPARAIDPVRGILDKLAGEPLTIWEIWTTVTDEHDSDASYAAIRDYIRGRRLAGQTGPPPEQIPARRRPGPRPGSACGGDEPRPARERSSLRHDTAGTSGRSTVRGQHPKER